MFLVLVEVGFLILCGLFMWTQVIEPTHKGRPIFPMFRKTEKIKETIIAKQGEPHNEELLDHVDQLDTKIIEKRDRRLKK